MYIIRSVITFSSISNYQRCEHALKSFSKLFSSTGNFVEPTAVAYRAAMKQGVPLEELPKRVNFRGKPYKPVTLEESIQYLSSPEYHELYRGKPVWFYFRRNYKGHFPPKYPRKSCTRAHKLITSNPCPICRDEYLVIDHKNVDLLKQFLHPLSADILEPKVTGLCEVQHKSLLLAIEMARDMGTIQMRLPFRLFDYSEYYGDVMKPEELRQLASHVVTASGSGGQLEPLDDIYRKAARSLTNLPPSITSLLHRSAIIPHIEEVAAEPPTVEIERPKIPNRYQMEEAYRKLLLKRKRAKSILLNDYELYQISLFQPAFLCYFSTSASCQFIAPQTRMRIVDNSQFSSIAPEQKRQVIKKGGVKQGAQEAPVTPSRDEVKDVKSFLQIGIGGVSKRKPMVIRVYNQKNRGVTGDKVLLAVNGQKKRGWIVGCRMPSRNGWPRFESNNVVLVDDEGNPLGSRILVPIPSKLRSLQSTTDITKILSIATAFV
ncbi:unnamed protein product [Taenia asiatica]|uniref:Small ribosomal subunit protein mS40 n=1 Tax=Taenia asiatica TaxID=60517 RepID=A0A0R3WB51_TAEAS|nr:unnamed protein product [Taenia asiatica]